MNNEPTKRGALESDSGYPKLVCSIEGGNPIQGLCNTPEELREFQNQHAFVQACDFSADIHTFTVG